jgi:hypothetical protein
VKGTAPARHRKIVRFCLAGLALTGLIIFVAWFWIMITGWPFDEYEAKRRQAEAAQQLGIPVEDSPRGHVWNSE